LNCRLKKNKHGGEKEKEKRSINKPDEKKTACTFRPINIRDVMKVDPTMMK
jgi:hypothetical protein